MSIEDWSQEKLFYYRAKLVKVVDGDTMDFDIDLGMDCWLKNQRIRLANIDTHEIYSVKHSSEEYRLGMLSKNALEELCAEAVEFIVHTYKDKRNRDLKTRGRRYVADVMIIHENGDIIDAAAELIRLGHDKQSVIE